MNVADELAEARTRIAYLESALTQDGDYSARLLDERHATIADLRHQLEVRADENQRLEYELRNTQGEAQRLAKLSGLYYDNQARAAARIAELEAERNSLLATESFDYDSYGKALLRVAALEGESEGRRRALSELVNERNEEWARAEQAEAEAARYRKVIIGGQALLLALEPHLVTPYSDDPRWTPWTRFCERWLESADRALAAAEREPSESCGQCGCEPDCG